AAVRCAGAVADRSHRADQHGCRTIACDRYCRFTATACAASGPVGATARSRRCGLFGTGNYGAAVSAGETVCTGDAGHPAARLRQQRSVAHCHTGGRAGDGQRLSGHRQADYACCGAGKCAAVDTSRDRICGVLSGCDRFCTPRGLAAKDYPTQSFMENDMELKTFFKHAFLTLALIVGSAPAWSANEAAAAATV